MQAADRSRMRSRHRRRRPPHSPPTTGTAHRRIASKQPRDTIERATCISVVRADSSRTSAPAHNARPAPVSTTLRALGKRSVRLRNRSRSSRKCAKPSAFTGGVSIVTTSTRSAVSDIPARMVSSGIEPLIVRSTGKMPTARGRCSGIARIASDLHGHFMGRPTTASPSSLLFVPRPPPSRNRVSALTAGGPLKPPHGIARRAKAVVAQNRR